MTIILAVIGVGLIVLEVFTASTFFIWIAVGFIAASLVSLTTESIVVIAICGVVATLLSLGLLRTRYAKYILPKENAKTAFNELIGEHAIMEADYTSNGVDVGVARASGASWSVQCAVSGVTFTKGERVVIEKIEGARLIIAREE